MADRTNDTFISNCSVVDFSLMFLSSFIMKRPRKEERVYYKYDVTMSHVMLCLNWF